jgi:hypothetical protein
MVDRANSARRHPPQLLSYGKLAPRRAGRRAVRTQPSIARVGSVGHSPERLKVELIGRICGPVGDEPSRPRRPAHPTPPGLIRRRSSTSVLRRSLSRINARSGTSTYAKPRATALIARKYCERPAHLRQGVWRGGSRMLPERRSTRRSSSPGCRPRPTSAGVATRARLRAGAQARPSQNAGLREGKGESRRPTLSPHDRRRSPFFGAGEPAASPAFRQAPRGSPAPTGTTIRPEPRGDQRNFYETDPKTEELRSFVLSKDQNWDLSRTPGAACP